MAGDFCVTIWWYFAAGTMTIDLDTTITAVIGTTMTTETVIVTVTRGSNERAATGTEITRPTNAETITWMIAKTQATTVATGASPPITTDTMMPTIIQVITTIQGLGAALSRITV